MIEKLNINDIKEASEVYNKGLQMEVPKGYSTLKNTIKKLKKLQTFVYKENKKIKGLISFKIDKNNIYLSFICALPLRKGIGKKLMKKVAEFAIENNTKNIFSSVSYQDKKAMKFYEKLGFEKYDKKTDKDFTLFLIKVKPEKILNSF